MAPAQSTRHAQRPRNAGGRLGLASLLSLLVAAPACAQDADPVIDQGAVREQDLRLSQQSPRALIANDVLQRPRLGYDAVGITLGEFRAYPKVALSLAYDSNIFDTPARQGDVEAIVQPSLSVQSNWERHKVGFDASGTIERFARHGSENVESYDVAVNGVLDFGLGGHLHGLGRIARADEDRGSVGDLFPGGRPIHYHKGQVTGGIEEHLPGVYLSLDGDFARYNYDDVRYQGIDYDQSYRDRDESRVTGQAALRVAPRLSVFTELSASSADYRPQPGTSDFSSHGVSALIGLAFQVPALLSGELGIGYVRQTYDILPLKPVPGLTYDLSALWNVTPMWTVTASAHRSIQQTPFPQAPSIIESRLALKVDYELLRNLLLNLQTTVTLDDFGGLNPIDQRLSADFGAHYLMSPTLSADLLIGWRRQRARSDFLRAYQGVAVRIGLTAQR